MKQTLLACALLGAFTPAARAQSDDIQLYGQLNLALESVQDSGHAMRVSNHRSVFGLRGGEAITGGLRLHYQGFNEERPADGARPALSSGALQFERGPLFVALAHERHRDYQGPGLSDRGSKLALAWQFGRVRLALAGERLEYRTPTGSLRRDAWFAAVSRQAGAHGLRLAVARAKDGKGSATERIGFIAAGPDTGALHATVGYDYALSRRTSLFAFHTRIHNRAHGTVDFAINGLAPAEGARLRGTAMGLRHAF